MAEIVTCAACQRTLQIPSEYLGKTVQCPECKHVFEAKAAPPPADIGDARDAAIAPGTKRRKPTDHDDDYDEESPRRRRRYDDDDDFDPGIRRRDEKPHRGATILTLAILAMMFAPCGLILAPISWVMALSDLNEIRVGTMDASGQGLISGAKIVSIVALFWNIAWMIFICVMLVAGG